MLEPELQVGETLQWAAADRLDPRAHGDFVVMEVIEIVLVAKGHTAVIRVCFRGDEKCRREQEEAARDWHLVKYLSNIVLLNAAQDTLLAGQEKRKRDSN